MAALSDINVAIAQWRQAVVNARREICRLDTRICDNDRSVINSLHERFMSLLDEFPLIRGSTIAQVDLAVTEWDRFGSLAISLGYDSMDIFSSESVLNDNLIVQECRKRVAANTISSVLADSTNAHPLPNAHEGAEAARLRMVYTPLTARHVSPNIINATCRYKSAKRKKMLLHRRRSVTKRSEHGNNVS